MKVKKIPQGSALRMFIFMIATFRLCDVWAEGNEREAFYNYYHRNPDGTFILEQIDVSGIGVDLFSYKATYSGDAISAITGYYYQSDIVKFIDTVANNSVIKTKYFDKSNSPVYTRINTYMSDGFMNSIAVTEKGLEETSRSWIFFEKDTFGDSYNYYAVRVRDTSSFAEENTDVPGNAISGYIVSEGRVNKNYQPLHAVSRVRYPTKKYDTEQYGISLPVHIFEQYEYDTEGNDIEYLLFHNSTEFFKMERLITDDYLAEYQIYHNFPGAIGIAENLYVLKKRINISGTSWVFQTLSTYEDARFTKYLENIVLVNIIQSYIVNYIMEYYANNTVQGDKKDVIRYILGYVDQNDIDAEFLDHIVSWALNSMRKINYIKDDLYIEYYFSENYYYDEITDEVGVSGYTENGIFVICCSDEKVIFGDFNDKTPDSYLNLPSDIFPDNYTLLNSYYNDDSVLRPRMKR
jgi:hypothetical protein